MGIEGHWLESRYRATDAMDVEGAMSTSAEDIRVQIGNRPPTVGRDAARSGFSFLHQTVRGISHEFLNIWDPDDHTAILEAKVTYKRWGGDEVTLPCVSIFEHQGTTVTSFRLYIDFEPLFRGQVAPIDITGVIAVNPPGQEPRVGRDELWDALVAKAHDATRFVPQITECRVVDSGVDADGREWILRDVTISGERSQERVTFHPKEKVVFERTESRGMGQIENVIEEDARGDLAVRFRHNLRMMGVPEGSPLHTRLLNEARSGYETTLQNVVDNLRSAAAGASST